MIPHGVSRSWPRCAAGTQSSAVRFWNATASQPAFAAASINCLATPRSPLWLIPISATTLVG
jgi:hypothetical protein